MNRYDFLIYESRQGEASIEAETPKEARNKLMELYKAGGIEFTFVTGTDNEILNITPLKHERPPKELWQKLYENGEYVRHASHEVGSEENYNHIDGVNNNRKLQRPIWVDPRKRPSVRKRLQEKLNQVHGGKEKQRTREKA